MGKCICESSKNGKFFCRATTYGKCQGVACAFYTSEDDAEQTRRKTHKRIRTLPNDSQRVIADTYYNGAMPWKVF